MRTRMTRAVATAAMTTILAALALSLMLGYSITTPAFSQHSLPQSPPSFTGKIGKTYKESEPAWQKIPTAAKDAPNVVVILLDDVGFGQTSTFGGLIPTPSLGKLASEGLRYNRFHTMALCSPRSSSPAPSSRYGSI